MRLPTLSLIGALGLAGAAVSAQATPLAPAPDMRNTPNVVRVADGCGWGYHYVPGHWSRWRGEWVPPHCAPNGPGYRSGAYAYPYYQGEYPYQYGYRHWYGY